MFPFGHKSLRVGPFVLLAVLVLSGVALVAIPHAGAAAAPGGSAASIEASCSGEAHVMLSNPSGAELTFDVARSGRQSTPSVSVVLEAGGSTTLTMALQRNHERLSVRVNGTTLADRYVDRQGPCAEGSTTLPTVPAGAKVLISGPRCGSDATITLPSASSEATSLEVWNDAAPVRFAAASVQPGQVVSVTKAIAALAGENLSVRSGADVLDKHAVTAKAPCVAGASTDASPWGDPARIDDFSSKALDTGKSGWYVYDSPSSSPPRTKSSLRLGTSADGVSEMQAVGTFDRATRKQQGSGAADRYNQKYGRWEVRARADKGSGFAPTLLLWPQKENWPTDGEIDLLELYQGDRQKGLAVVHNGPGNTFKTQGIAMDHTQWHVYAVEWLPDRVTFFVDDKEVWTVRDPKLVPTTDAMHLVIQNDAGCGWIQCPNAQTAPETVFHVDWVKVYSAPEPLLAGRH